MNINRKISKYNHYENRNGGGVNDIEYIVIHYVGALGGAEANCEWYAGGNRGASAHYIVGFNGEIWQSVEDKDGAWSVGKNYGGYLFGKANNKNTLNIEMCVRKKSTKTMNATDKDWYFEDATVKSTIELTKYLMKKYGIKEDHVVRHYDVCKKWCPAPYCENNTKHTWADFKAAIMGKTTASTGTQASEFAGLAEKDAVNKILELVHRCDKSGILNSVTAAQMILESGYVTTDLAENANNCFGMKCTLSGNTWAGSSWDGTSKYRKKTAEQKSDGTVYYVTADFRKYPCIEDSVKDHAAYLLGAKNGTNKRYAGLKEAKSYREAVAIIKSGGYATDTQYVVKICNIIERYGLNKYDTENVEVEEKNWYRVRKSWGTTMDGQLGAYMELDNAKEDCPAGYKVYSPDGKELYNGTRALIDRVCDWAIGIANDNSHGYNNAGNGWGPEYNCIGLVMQAFNCNGLQVGKCSIDKMPTYLIEAAFEDVTADVDVKTGKGLVKGDVLWLLDKTGKHGHTELYLGDGRLVGARQDIDGKSGDSSGNEIVVDGYTDMSWQKVFRLPGGYIATEAPEDPKVTYRVQAGAFDIKANADKMLDKVKSAGYQDAFIRHEDGKYKVQAWAGSVRSNAEKVVTVLQKKGIKSIIK